MYALVPREILRTGTLGDEEWSTCEFITWMSAIIIITLCKDKHQLTGSRFGVSFSMYFAEKAEKSYWWRRKNSYCFSLMCDDGWPFNWIPMNLGRKNAQTVYSHGFVFRRGWRFVSFSFLFFFTFFELDFRSFWFSTFDEVNDILWIFFGSLLGI